MAIWKRCHKRNNVQLALFIFLIHHKVNFHFMVRFNSLKYDLISGELNKYFATNSFNSLDSGTIWTEALQACAIAQNQTKPPPQPVETSTWSRREACFFWHQLVPALLLCQQSRCLHSSRNPVLCGGECIFVRDSTRARPTPHRGVDLL